MTTFDERETAFEAKFAHDQEMQFKANARRNKYLGLWAAEQKGEPLEVAQAYARSVVKTDMSSVGHEDVVSLLAGYLGDLADEQTIRAKMAEFMITAKAEIMEETS